MQRYKSLMKFIVKEFKNILEGIFKFKCVIWIAQLTPSSYFFTLQCDQNSWVYKLAKKS